MRPLLLIIFISTILTFCNSAKTDPINSATKSNGQKLSLRDNTQEGDEEEYFTYENYFPELNAYLIRVQLYEGSNYLLVNRTNGNKKYVVRHPNQL